MRRCAGGGRADTIGRSGVPSGVDPGSISVDVDGRDVTSAFAVRSDGRFLGRVEQGPRGHRVGDADGVYPGLDHEREVPVDHGWWRLWSGSRRFTL